MIGTKETSKLKKHLYRLLHEIPGFWSTSQAKMVILVLLLRVALCNIVKANGMRVNVIILQCAP
jgi:hypothetical protein